MRLKYTRVDRGEVIAKLDVSNPCFIEEGGDSRRIGIKLFLH